MKCEECRGACCESFTTEIAVNPPSADAQRWIRLHSSAVPPKFHKDAFAVTVAETNAWEELTFECRCTKLTPEGRCGIYEDRPLICELFIAGSRRCLETVKQRRTVEDYQRIVMKKTRRLYELNTRA
ncbi:MAG: hypothetical protein JW395_1068 [Nitrospira sp.]|nr:hypothetical protein [Nitrospira sp.]